MVGYIGLCRTCGAENDLDGWDVRPDGVLRCPECHDGSPSTVRAGKLEMETLRPLPEDLAAEPIDGSPGYCNMVSGGKIIGGGSGDSPEAALAHWKRGHRLSGF